MQNIPFPRLSFWGLLKISNFKLTKETIKWDVKKHIKMCLEINIELLLIQTNEDENTTKISAGTNHVLCSRGWREK